MLDHIGFDVSDIQKSKAFYTQALAPLGYEVFMEWENWVGFAVNKKPDFWLKHGSKTSPRVHVAFRAKNHAEVRAFYEAAMAAGGTDNGKPGPRTEYHEHYYGAFVLDPDGNNIEAVCHEPQG